MSRKVVLYIASSLDGFIADKEGKLNWLGGDSNLYDGDYGYTEFIQGIDTVVMGANTYNQIAYELSPTLWPYSNKKTFVFTHKENLHDGRVTFLNNSLKEFIHRQKETQGKAIWICGGANFANELIKEGMIDEFHIVTMPIILGSGMRLFYDDNPKIKLKLKYFKEINGAIESVYIQKK